MVDGGWWVGREERAAGGGNVAMPRKGGGNVGEIAKSDRL